LGTGRKVPVDEDATVVVSKAQLLVALGVITLALTTYLSVFKMPGAGSQEVNRPQP
jgi:hypothetical protein